MDPALQEVIAGTPAGAAVEVIVKLRPPFQPPSGVSVVSRFGEHIVTARVRSDLLQQTWASEGVESLKAARYVAWEPPTERDDDVVAPSGWPRARGVSSEHLPQRGRGVVVGLVDWGADFAHPNFLDENGASRLLALWDQGADAEPRPSNEYGYGTIYSREQINRALRSSAPYSVLGYHPAQGDPLGNGAHGTHVMDIAAGGGRVPGASVGIAPACDLVFVHLSMGRTRGNLGSSVRLLEALDFIVRTADRRPVVINVSLGRHGGPHDGSTLVEEAMDALLEAAPGRAIIQSTGNYYGAHTHASGRLLPRGQHRLGWIIEPYDLTPNELEIWYSGRDRFSVGVSPPGGASVTRAALGERVSIVWNGQEVGRLYHRPKDPNNGDHHVDIFLDRHAPSGRWEVVLSGDDIVDGRFHCWIERDPGVHDQSHFDLEDADPTCTTNTICNGFRTIAVGAYEASSPQREVAPFSSSGPTRSGRQKPDIVAPGVRILAARSAGPGTERPEGLLVSKSGTSMAAPHVTGTVALMFEAAGPLAIEETRGILLESTDPLAGVEKAVARLGCGYLNVERAVNAASARRIAASRVSRKREPSPSGRSERRSAPASFPEELSPSSAVARARFRGADLSPRVLFDSFVLLGRAGGSSPLEEHFRVVAFPGCRPALPLRAGDLLIQRPLGEGHLSIVSVMVDGRVLDRGELPPVVSACAPRPGYYVEVSETGAFPAQAAAVRRRWLCWPDGRLGEDRLVLRSKSG